MLRRRTDVDHERIGLLGYSMGANASIYALPEMQPIRAAMLVQPVRATTFAQNLAVQVHGSVGHLLAQLAGPVHQLAGAPPLQSIDPTGIAPKLGETRTWYIQGSGDPWGNLAETEAMASATPNALPLTVVPARDRYEGYLFVERHLDEVAAFFRENLL
jgi:dienelactone hydrolase